MYYNQASRDTKIRVTLMSKPSQSKNNKEASQSDSDLSISFQQEQFNRIYTNQLKKREREIQPATIQPGTSKGEGNRKQPAQRQRSRSMSSQKSLEQDRSRSREKQRSIRWHIYDICDSLVLDSKRFSPYVLQLPIYKKKAEILNHIINNQVVLVTGETGCGKSTQVPRLLYEYIRQTGLNAKIICVQPRRLAVKNLHKLLGDQIPEKGAVGYHIAMQTFIRENTKILFMTNGIFLQRLIHGTQFFEEFPFIVLDEVHERDIDTDFILLSMKRMLRNHPKIRVILMSATIDNKLFEYYFAEDEVDEFMNRENFYKKFIRLEEQEKANRQVQEEDGYRIQRMGQQEDLYKKIQMDYLKAKLPCPTVNVTEKGKYTKKYYYLDTLSQFLKRNVCIKWGSMSFMEKSPQTGKELYLTCCEIIQDIMLSRGSEGVTDRSNESTLVFLPGLAEIEFMVSEMSTYFGRRIENFELIKCHSSILNDDTTKKLHTLYRDKFKIIIATNIAESSITVVGVKYVIDFCLSKEVNFNQKSRMENLELVWASKASCEQRAGRTGRVCDGIVIRMVEKAFYNRLPEYSTPEIQRSSLDKLILRIKLIHENEKNGHIFEDPGEVLGTAIQPPNLKHIDEAIKSLVICGGLRVEDEKLVLTKLGRIYVDIPLDIIYSKMLIFSMLMGTYDDILILVCILSQNKNAFRKSVIERHPLEYFQVMSNPQRCDFVALINAFRGRDRRNSRDRRASSGVVEFDIYHETVLLIEDVSRRIRNKKFLKKIPPNQSTQDYEQKLKMTLAFGFLNTLIKFSPMIYDDRQEKRVRLMKKQGISVRNTIVLLNSDVIRKSNDYNQEVDNRLRKNWINNIATCFRIEPENIDMTLGQGISFVHFREQTDLNKVLFIKFMEKKKGINYEAGSSSSRVLTLGQILPHLGDIDYMEEGNPSELAKDHKVNIDSFSGNRVVGVSKQNESYEFPQCRLAMTNSITQQSSRLSCRFASLLPDISNLETILHLVFYPYVSLVPDRKQTKYQTIYLKKHNKLHINYELTYEQICEANRIRQTIRELMELSLFLEDEVDLDVIEPVLVTEDGVLVQNNPGVISLEAASDRLQPDIPFQVTVSASNPKLEHNEASVNNKMREEKMREFWPALKSFLHKARKPVIQEQKWQELYFKQKRIEAKTTLTKHIKEDEKQFMNQIKPIDLCFSYFSSNFHSDLSVEQRLAQYEDWKLRKYNQAVALEELAGDHDPYIVCSTCQVKVAKLNKIGPINNQYFREIFDHIDGNVQPLVYNELGDYFCSMLMTIYMEKEYDVYGCKNGHYLALKFKEEKRLKILAFSPISILYTDGTLDEEPEFEAMEYRRWREKFESSKASKLKKPTETCCFVCGDKFRTIKQVEQHVKNQYHEANMRDFRSTIPQSKRPKPKFQLDGGY